MLQLAFSCCSVLIRWWQLAHDAVCGIIEALLQAMALRHAYVAVFSLHATGSAALTGITWICTFATYGTTQPFGYVAQYECRELV
jgi:hypothetical protein